MAREKAKKIVNLYDKAKVQQIDLGNYKDQMISVREQLLEFLINKDYASYIKLFNNTQDEWWNISFINNRAEINKKVYLEKIKAAGKLSAEIEKRLSVRCVKELSELLKDNLHQDIQHYLSSTKINYNKDLIDFLLEVNLSYEQRNNEILNLIYKKIDYKTDTYLRFNRENSKYGTCFIFEFYGNIHVTSTDRDETVEGNYPLQVRKAIYRNYNLDFIPNSNTVRSELNILHKAMALDNLNGYLKKDKDKATTDLKLPYQITAKDVNSVISTLALLNSSSDDKMILKHRVVERIKTSIKFRLQDLNKTTADEDIITVIKKQADLIIKIITDLGSKIEYVNSVNNKNIENDQKQNKIAKIELQQLDETIEVPKQILSLKTMAAVVTAVALNEGEIDPQDLQNSTQEVSNIVSDIDYMIKALTYEGIMIDKSQDGHLDNQILYNLELLEGINKLLEGINKLLGQNIIIDHLQ